MKEANIVYIAEAAVMLNKTEQALRAIIQRAERMKRRANLPPYMKVGGRWAFTRSGIAAFVKKGGA